MRPLDALNQLSPPEFAEALKPLFEAAAPLSNALYAARPFASYQQLIDTAERLVGDMSFEDQILVLSAHPRIGASPDTLSAASLAEQGQLEPATVYAQLTELNDEYERRFGFRFVVFVNRRPKSAIIEILASRLTRPRDEELHTGLTEMFNIARDRYAQYARA